MASKWTKMLLIVVDSVKFCECRTVYYWHLLFSFAMLMECSLGGGGNELINLFMCGATFHLGGIAFCGRWQKLILNKVNFGGCFEIPFNHT
jgi:hypothetical protein